MKKSSLSWIICALLILSFFSLVLPLQSVIAEAPGSWSVTTSYPLSVTGSSCATDGSYIYCVGGISVNSVYSAPISSSGIGTWTLQTNYPTNAYLPSCAISGGYIYCVGGLTGPSTNTNAVYYAHLTSGSVGAWGSGTNYPTNIEATSCVISGGYITCVAGLTVPSFISTITNAVYYAPVSSSGVGAWSSTTNYPITDNLDTCSASGGYIICMGGEYDMTHGFVTNAVYYDTLSAGAVGTTWSSATIYPLGVSSWSRVLRYLWRVHVLRSGERWDWRGRILRRGLIRHLGDVDLRARLSHIHLNRTGRNLRGLHIRRRGRNQRRILL